MSEAIVGSCTTDANPDHWFTEIPNGGHQPTMIQRILPQIQYAIDTCKKCPKKDDCLAEGMKQENITNGIWGGMLAGDRMRLSNERGENLTMYRHEKNAAYALADKIKPFLKEQT